MWQCGREEKRIKDFDEESREFSEAEIGMYNVLRHYLHYFIWNSCAKYMHVTLLFHL